MLYFSLIDLPVVTKSYMYRIMFSIYFDLFAYPSCFDAFCMHILTFSCLPFVRSDRTVESDRRTNRRPDDLRHYCIALAVWFCFSCCFKRIRIDHRQSLPSWTKGHKI